MLFNYFTRVFTLFAAIAGLMILGYYVYTSFPDLSPQTILCISIPDMLFFYLAYKTYPQQSSRDNGRQNINLPVLTGFFFCAVLVNSHLQEIYSNGCHSC
jgi:hypothetical protein